MMPQQSQRDLKKFMIAGLQQDIENAFEMEAEAAERSSLDQETLERVNANLNKNDIS